MNKEEKSFEIYRTPAVILPIIASFVLVTVLLIQVDKPFHIPLVGTKGVECIIQA